MKLTKKQRQELYLKYDKKCAYCGSDLPIKGWHADHSFAILRHHYYDKEKKKFIASGDSTYPKNDVFENMLPSCASCNIFKGGSDIEDFRKRIGNQLQQTRQSSKSFRLSGLLKLRNLLFFGLNYFKK